MNVLAGSTDVTTYFVLRTAADGLEKTGATITDIDLQYVRSGAAPVAKVDATALAATDSAHADNKAIEVDGTDQPGLYRVDWPDAAFAAGAREVILTVKLATCFTENLRVDLTPVGANVLQVGSSAQSATDLKDLVDTGYDPSTHKVQGVVTVDTTTTNMDMVSEPLDAAGVRTAVGLASANLDTQLAAIVMDTGTTLDGKVDKIKAAVYDSAPKEGSLITLSDGTTQLVTAVGRETTEP